MVAMVDSRAVSFTRSASNQDSPVNTLGQLVQFGQPAQGYEFIVLVRWGACGALGCVAAGLHARIRAARVFLAAAAPELSRRMLVEALWARRPV
jgi:hypothetical protein